MRRSAVAAYELLESRLVADRIEVGVLLGVGAVAVGSLDRGSKVLDCVLGSTDEALAAGDVVEQPGIPGVRVQQLPPALDHLVVPTRLVEGVERPPDRPRGRLVRLARNAAEGDERRFGLRRDGRSLHAGACKDERA